MVRPTYRMSPVGRPMVDPPSGSSVSSDAVVQPDRCVAQLNPPRRPVVLPEIGRRQPWVVMVKSASRRRLLKPRQTEWPLAAPMASGSSRPSAGSRQRPLQGGLVRCAAWRVRERLANKTLPELQWRPEDHCGDPAAQLCVGCQHAVEPHQVQPLAWHQRCQPLHEVQRRHEKVRDDVAPGGLERCIRTSSASWRCPGSATGRSSYSGGSGSGTY